MEESSLVRIHLEGEGESVEKIDVGPIPVETFGGKIHVEWNPQAAVTALGQLPFFIEFLKTADLFDPWVEDCPMRYQSPNAPDKRDVLGTTFLSVLGGHWRYSHITTIRCDSVNPKLLGMKRVVSEDSVRRGFSGCEEKASEDWLHKHLSRCYEPLLYEPWILDLDTTVKPLYGHQQGAVVGYNPHKPGRPSHSYHTYFMAQTRLALEVEVQAGNHTAACYSQPGLWNFLDPLPEKAKPKLVRGDCNFGNDSMMTGCEKRKLAYLFKLRQSKNVKRLIREMFHQRGWLPAGKGWQGLESELKLQGWEKPRRVIVLRREIKDVAFTKESSSFPKQLVFASIESGTEVKKYEYAVLVTSLQEEILTIAQLYRDRADIENNFDELKNQWSWGGYTTHDLKRCQIMARITALIYNWWSLFVRLAIPQKHAEAITSRPLLLQAMGKQTEHQRQVSLTITSTHAKTSKVQKILRKISQFLQTIKNAEQLTWFERWCWILSRVFISFLKGRPLKPPLLSPQPL